MHIFEFLESGRRKTPHSEIFRIFSRPDVKNAPQFAAILLAILRTDVNPSLMEVHQHLVDGDYMEDKAGNILWTNEQVKVLEYASTFC